MIAFDVAAALFLLSAAPLLRSGDRDAMRWRAKTNDANRTVLLGLTFLTMLAILTSVAKELGGHPDRGVVALVIATLVLAWLFTNSVYALHYAHIFYGDADGSGKDDGGLDFPKTPDVPDQRRRHDQRHDAPGLDRAMPRRLRIQPRRTGVHDQRAGRRRG